VKTAVAGSMLALLFTSLRPSVSAHSYALTPSPGTRERKSSSRRVLFIVVGVPPGTGAHQDDNRDGRSSGT